MSILAEADLLIVGDRRNDYGPVEESFEWVASMWSTWLGMPISPEDVAVMMALLKICREKNRHKRDNLVDAAGYIGLASHLQKD